MPKVSVVIPTYNRKDLLSEAIASVQSQTFHDYEILVIDHGSTDGTSAWVRNTYADAVRLIQLDFCPLPACPRNRGIQEARGEYVAFLDSDDLWLPSKLTLQMEAFAKHREAGWSYGMAERFGLGIAKPTADIARWQLQSGWVLDAFLMGNFLASCTVVVKKSILDDVGGFDTSPDLRSTEDYELWIRLAAKSQICVVPELIGRIRIASDNVSHNLANRLAPEKMALESAQRKLNLSPGRMAPAMAALYLRHFRYAIENNPELAIEYLDKSWSHAPWHFRQALYKTVLRIAGAPGAKAVINSERWFKQCVG
jgi:glycosyltransferase involved in cell wall biosynthesis